MDINEIKKLIKIFENAKVTELSIQEGDLKIKISKNGASSSPIQVQYTSPAVEMPMPHIQPTEQAPVKQVQEEAKSDDNLHIINSPIVGTFYRSPAPDADPYVQINDSVSSGSVLCIVEAMKLMNEIECDINGKIVQILVEDGTPVEFNQPLFKIEKS
jgi:acetyl-CoA carboxylase biotin carboxyl carrier protein